MQVQDRNAQSLLPTRRTGLGQGWPVPTAAAAAAPSAPSAAGQPAVAGQLSVVGAVVANVRAQQLQAAQWRKRCRWNRRSEQQAEEETGRQGVVCVRRPGVHVPYAHRRTHTALLGKQ